MTHEPGDDAPHPIDDGPTYPDPDARCASCEAPIPAYSIVVCRTCLSAGYCSICGLAHRPTQCPDVVLARLGMVETERLMHSEMVATWANNLLARYEAQPVWMEAA